MIFKGFLAWLKANPAPAVPQYVVNSYTPRQYLESRHGALDSGEVLPAAPPHVKAALRELRNAREGRRRAWTIPNAAKLVAGCSEAPSDNTEPGAQ